MDKTSLGNRMKMYEKAYTRKAMPLLPVIARLDGKAFHTWTKGLDRPFDEDFMRIMQETTRRLVEETDALIGYTQSDEITLVFFSPDPESQIFFDGKLEKMNSVLASMCTAYFNIEVQKTVSQLWTTTEPEDETDKASMNKRTRLFFHKPPALFDCRVFQVPTLEEAVNCLIWREQDATRNSILSVAQSKFSHKEMQNKSTAELQEMMFQLDGTNWSKDFTPEQKRGTYFSRVKTVRPFTAKEIEKLPPRHHARSDPNLKVTRTDVQQIVLPKLTSIKNRVSCILLGAKPETDDV